MDHLAWVLLSPAQIQMSHPPSTFPQVLVDPWHHFYKPLFRHTVQGRLWPLIDYFKRLLLPAFVNLMLVIGVFILHSGSSGIPLHWSLQADSRAVCFRFAPEGPNEPGPQWSHPVDLEKALNAAARFASLPVRPASAPEAPLISLEDGNSRDDEGVEKILPAKQKKRGSYLREVTTLQTAAVAPWELHGLQIRVGHRARRYSMCCLFSHSIMCNYILPIHAGFILPVHEYLML